jgi:hypothetical protein
MIRFLNVDLEVRSHVSLQPIVDDFGDNALSLYFGEVQEHYLATFEANDSGSSADADSIIAYFCMLVRSFKPEAKQLWESAFSKIFDIGYESGLEPRSYSSLIRADTIAQVADLGASLRVTIYPPHPPH